MSSVLAPTIADVVFEAMACGKSASVIAICRRHYDLAMKSAAMLVKSNTSEYERGQIKAIANQCHMHMKNMQKPDCADRSFQACEALSCACAIEVSRSSGHWTGSGLSEWSYFNLRNQIVMEIKNA